DGAYRNEENRRILAAEDVDRLDGFQDSLVRPQEAERGQHGPVRNFEALSDGLRLYVRVSNIPLGDLDGLLAESEGVQSLAIIVLVNEERRRLQQELSVLGQAQDLAGR